LRLARKASWERRGAVRIQNKLRYRPGVCRKTPTYRLYLLCFEKQHVFLW
jgi:hypothetical protein